MSDDLLTDEEMKYVCGIDVSYVNDSAHCSAVTMERYSYKVTEIANLRTRTANAYIPGLFMISYIGLILDKPTIGVGKRLLCGSVRNDQFIEDGGQVLGFKISNQKNYNKSVYVSVGNHISLSRSIRLVKELTRKDHWIPEPLRIADINSKKILNFQD